MAIDPILLVWTREMAVELCTLIQGVSPPFNAHPALTGGLLYKEGKRKDCDIVIYRRGDTNGVRPDLDWEGLWKAMTVFQFYLVKDYGYVKKCVWRAFRSMCSTLYRMAAITQIRPMARTNGRERTFRL